MNSLSPYLVLVLGLSFFSLACNSSSDRDGRGGSSGGTVTESRSAAGGTTASFSTSIPGGGTTEATRTAETIGGAPGTTGGISMETTLSRTGGTTAGAGGLFSAAAGGVSATPGGTVAVTGGTSATSGGATTAISLSTAGRTSTAGTIGAGGTTGTGGVTGRGGAAGTAGAGGSVGRNTNCTAVITGTAQRPLLTEASAACYTIQNYLAQSGSVSAPVRDDWDPGDGLPDASTYSPTYTVAKDGSGTHSTVQGAMAGPSIAT